MLSNVALTYYPELSSTILISASVRPQSSKGQPVELGVR